ILIRPSDGWHDFSNVPYHCWPPSASASSPTPLTTCTGATLRWVEAPPSEIKAEVSFNVTYEFVVDASFYTWATSNSYFTTPGYSTAATAQSWCENTACPAAASATGSNCCVHHVNVHSCPLAKTSLCGPWIPDDGQVFTHSDVLVGPIQQGNWTSHIGGLYEIGLTSIIAHFKVADLHFALEAEVIVIAKSSCGDGSCDTADGESCETCPRDCGNCPLEPWAYGLIATFVVLILIAVGAVFGYFQYQKRKLLWDDSWIIPHERIKEDEGLRGAFGSMISVNMGSGADISGVSSNMALSAQRKQVFTKTAILDGKTVAVRDIKKKEFSVTKAIRWEVKAVRELDHQNLCKLAGACVQVPHVCVLTEYCPKGSLSDLLLNDEIPLNWAFRFSFSTDIARGMAYMHSHKLYHGRLKSNNCVIDDRWTVKVTDYGLPEFRRQDELLLTEDDEDDLKYKQQRNRVYVAPEYLVNDRKDPSQSGDVYSFSMILVEIATRNDPYGDEDPFDLPQKWKPPLPDLSPEMAEDTESACPCPSDYLKLIKDCWNDDPEERPSFEDVKKTIHKINPHKMSPVDLMMAMMEKYSKHLESIVTERTQDLVAEKQKTDRLLYSMLPKQVADDLKIGRQIDAESFEACTIYFSDIVGFTNLSGGSTPMQVVALLNKLYITFDEIIDKYDVYKVETIGDACERIYMVVSGIPTRTPFHAREVANMAIDLVAACQVFEIPHRPKEPLKIRVGLHSGPACAGVVGLKMPRYCLFGDTVNTASRMESNGEAYKIHISNYTYIELINIGGFKFDRRGTIPIKGKGEMVTWWLQGREENYKPEEITAPIITPSTPKSPKPPNDKSSPHHKGKTHDELKRKNPEGTEFIFTPVESTEEETKTRKISAFSMSNDSGYNERHLDGSQQDVSEIVVRSYTSLLGKSIVTLNSNRTVSN
ncbi:hypothetical protein FSP39_008227, partial [Pinctada imbricata]